MSGLNYYPTPDDKMKLVNIQAVASMLKFQFTLESSYLVKYSNHCLLVKSLTIIAICLNQ